MGTNCPPSFRQAGEHDTGFHWDATSLIFKGSQQTERPESPEPAKSPEPSESTDAGPAETSPAGHQGQAPAPASPPPMVDHTSQAPAEPPFISTVTSQEHQGTTTAEQSLPSTVTQTSQGRSQSPGYIWVKPETQSSHGGQVWTVDAQAWTIKAP